MNIGLFFGSFNPIHIGHLLIAQHFVNENVFDKVIFVLSPQNPFKQSKDLWDENFRFDLLKKAIDNNSDFEASNIEFNMSKPSYTYDTVLELTKKYPLDRLNIIIGSDNLAGLKKWKNIELLKKLVSFHIYTRNKYDIIDIKKENKLTFHNDIKLFPISSTLIRQNLSIGKSIKYLVPEIILQNILDHYEH